MIDKYIKICKSIQEVETIRSKWEAMQWHPNSDIDYFLMIVGSRREIVKPYVVIAGANGHEAIVVGRIEDAISEIKIGYKPLFKWQFRQLSIVHGGLLGEYCEQNTEMLLSAIYNALREGEADSVLFNHIPADSLLYKWLMIKTPYCWRDHLPDRSIHWKITLSVDFNAFLNRMSSKTRYNLRRTEKLFEKAFNGQIKVKKFVDEHEVDIFAADAEKVAKTGYQRGLGVGFEDNREMRERLKVMAGRGLLRSYILYAGDVPCTFWMGTKYHSTLFLDSTGYNPEFRKYEVGTILFLKMIEDLYQEKSLREVDFGLGHASYKERFSDTSMEDCTMYVWAPRIKGMIYNVIKTIIGCISICVKRLLLKIGSYENIKKKWRTSKESNKIEKDKMET